MSGAMTWKREGFPGQRLLVVPRAIVRSGLDDPVTGSLLVTDCGYFPRAESHGRVRPGGAGQHIVVVCTHGRGWADVDGVHHEVSAGQALVIPRRTPHSYGADIAEPWTIWWLHVAGRDAASLVDACGATLGSPVVDLPRPRRSAEHIAEVIDALERDTTRRSLIAASGIAWHLLTDLAVGRPDDVNGPVESIRQCLAEDLAAPLSIADLAAAVNMSSSHLTAVFKRKTGYSPMAYRTLMRMQRARTLLDTTDRPIAAIAAEVGYTDPAYFTRRFTQLHEQSPRGYRGTVKG